MQAVENCTHARDTAERNRIRALVRFNTLLFHALATASFLESMAPGHGSKLAVAATEPDTSCWLAKVWEPRREARARELRAYIETVWPEFDWAGAYEQFCSARRDRLGRHVCLPQPSRWALQRCVQESQAAAFYRAIANCADDSGLRELTRAAAADHAMCFEFFRSCLAPRGAERRFGLLAACRAVLDASRAARDTDVADAFFSLAGHWYGTSTVVTLDYRDFLRRLAPLVTRYARLGRLERLLFSPWSGRTVPAGTPIVTAGSGGPARWPTLKAAA